MLMKYALAGWGRLPAAALLAAAILWVGRPARWVLSDTPAQPRQRCCVADNMCVEIALPDHRAWRAAVFVDAFCRDCFKGSH